MKKPLNLKGLAVRYITEAQEDNSVWSGVDDVVDDAIQAVLSKTDDSEKIVVIDINRNYVRVMDNGIGQTHKCLENAYNKAVFHGWETNNGCGIKGVGRFKFPSICSDFSSPVGSEYIVQSSIGNDTYTEVIMHFCEHEPSLLTPTIEDKVNIGLEDNGINIINGKLKGTIVTLTPSRLNDTHLTEKIYLHYGNRYHDYIKYDKVKLIINGREIEPIDFPHISNIKEENVNSFIYDEENKTLGIYHKIEFFNKNDENEKFQLNVKGCTSLHSTLLRNKYPWENEFMFNELSGVYPKFRGRYLTNGGNVGSMFRQNVENGDTKGKGNYGDISGSYSGYNRIVLEFFDDKVAEILGVKTIKSQGIKSLSDNTSLSTDYFTYINGEKVSLFKAICHIRKFLDVCIYRNIVKKHKLNRIDDKDKKWESFFDLCSYYYSNYNFATGELKKGKKTINLTDIESKHNLINTDNNKHYIINDKTCLVKIEWVETNSGLKIVDFSFNNENKYGCKEEDASDFIITEFEILFDTLTKYAKLTYSDVKHILCSHSKNYAETLI